MLDKRNIGCPGSTPSRKYARVLNTVTLGVKTFLFFRYVSVGDFNKRALARLQKIRQINDFVALFNGPLHTFP